MRHANGTLYWHGIRPLVALLESALGAFPVDVPAAKPTGSTGDQ